MGGRDCSVLSCASAALGERTARRRKQSQVTGESRELGTSGDGRSQLMAPDFVDTSIMRCHLVPTVWPVARQSGEEWTHAAGDLQEGMAESSCVLPEKERKKKSRVDLIYSTVLGT